MDFSTEYIIAYLDGKLSVEECAELEAMLKNSPEYQNEFDNIAFIWQSSVELKLYKQIDTEGNWEKLSRKIKTDKLKVKILRFTRTAAAILLLPILILTYALHSELSYLKDQPVNQMEITSAYGTVSKTILPDGTEVWLNSGSTLTYPQTFKGNRRIVHLSGEAYFKVTSDKTNRFDVVVSDNLTVSAYGTEFNINGYKDDPSIDVTLVHGNVEIVDLKSANLKNIFPGQHLVYSKNSEEMEISKANLDVKTGWKDGKMIFRREKMMEVARRLSRHFNVDIRLEGSELYEYEYSATFTTETLNEILQLLAITAPIKYHIIEPKQSEDLSFTMKTVVISIRK